MAMKKINTFFKNTNKIHSVTRPILLTARCFGVFPVSGLISPSSLNLRFTLKSPYTIILIASVVGQFALFTMAFIHLFETGKTPRLFYKLSTYSAGTICTLIIIKLAKHWPDVVREATLIEKRLPEYNQKNIRTTCKIITGWIFLSALVDYVLSIKFYSRLTEACFQGESLLESYYIYTMPAPAAYIPYTPTMFIILQIIFFQITFVSNFTDVFIITISLYLSAFFEELNELINLYKDKSPRIWSVLRDQYTRLSRLVNLLDNNISSFIIFSFGINMVIICIQFFKIIRKDLAHATSHCDEEKLKATLASTERMAYFNFSIIFLITRSLMTALFAARVNTSARAALMIMYEVPSCCYSVEVLQFFRDLRAYAPANGSRYHLHVIPSVWPTVVTTNRLARRFVDQMHANTIALSGLHFFYVTRGMILTMVATVFTYELVLLQFSDKDFD